MVIHIRGILDFFARILTTILLFQLIAMPVALIFMSGFTLVETSWLTLQTKACILLLAMSCTWHFTGIHLLSKFIPFPTFFGLPQLLLFNLAMCVGFTYSIGSGESIMGLILAQINHNLRPIFFEAQNHNQQLLWFTKIGSIPLACATLIFCHYFGQTISTAQERTLTVPVAAHKSTFRIGLILIIISATCIVLQIWFTRVGFVPDNDSILIFLIPFINHATHSFQWNEFITGGGFYSPKYPVGMVLLSGLANFMGIGSTLAASPLLLSGFCLVPLFLGATVWIVERKLSPWVLVWFAMFPTVQIMAKTFSLHSVVNSVVFLIVMLLSLFWSSHQNQRKWQLVILVACTFTIAVKHLGIIWLICITVAAYLNWGLRSVQFLLWIKNFSYSIILASPFWILPFQEGKYIKTFVNPSSTWIVLAILVASLVGWWLAREKKSRGPNLNHDGWMLLFKAILVFSLSWTFQTGPQLEGNTKNLILLINLFYTSIIAASITYLIQRSFAENQLKNHRSFTKFMVLISGWAANILFGSLVGHSFSLFFLPALLLLTLMLEGHHYYQRRWIWLAGFFLISNFFPSRAYLEKTFGYSMAKLYFDGFNLIHLNPLSWEPTDFTEIRDKVYLLLSRIKFKENETPLVMVDNLHHYSATGLLKQIKVPEPFNFKHYYECDPAIVKTFIPDPLFLNSGASTSRPPKLAKILIEGIEPWTQYHSIHPFQMFGVANLDSKYWDWLRQNKLLEEHYKPYPIRNKHGIERVRVWILRNELTQD